MVDIAIQNWEACLHRPNTKPLLKYSKQASKSDWLEIGQKRVAVLASTPRSHILISPYHNNNVVHLFIPLLLCMDATWDMHGHLIKKIIKVVKS